MRGDALEVTLEVADHAMHRQVVEVRDERLSGGLDDDRRDVERDVAARAGGLRHPAEQDPGLGRRSGAELDELTGARQRSDLRGAGHQDRGLGTRWVVLRQLTDLVEQVRATGVIEVLRRKLLHPRQGQSGADVAGERALLPLRQPRLDRDPLVVGEQRHAATLNPAKIWRRSG